MDSGGAAHLAVSGGNLPPEEPRWRSALYGEGPRSGVGGLVARQDGQVARSTPTGTESRRPSPAPVSRKAGTRILLLATTLLCPSPCARAAAAASTNVPTNVVVPTAVAQLLPLEKDETGFQPLFSQPACGHWTQCGPGSFTLTNGVATSQGGMGLWWFTNRTFTNFVLRGEWRLEKPDSDSGGFVRFPPPGDDPWNAVRQGHEMEIGDDPAGKEPAWRTGALYPFSPPTRVPTRPVGEWNRFELIAVGHTYIVRINGETVNVWTDPQRRTLSGYVGLQNYQEGKGSQHRRLRIRELP